MKNRSRGFTLIELAMAIVIIAIAIAPLSVILGNIISKTVLPEVLNVSNYLAEQELERISTLRFSQINSQAQTSYAGNFSRYSYQITVTAVPAALANDPLMQQYKQVSITIQNFYLSAVTVTTLVSNYLV